MTQHPIPQDITNYKFHLIGNMTLKQFAELAGGAIIAFIVYKSNLIGIVRWPLFIFIVLLSIMIAFVPFEERPLDHWIITFFKNLWRPTKFFWKKTPKVPDFFNFKANDPNQVNQNPDVNYSPARKSRIQEYLRSIPQGDEKLDDWDIFRQNQARELVKEFDQVRVRPENISVQKEDLSKPQLKTRVRKLKNPDTDLAQNMQPPVEMPVASPTKTSVELPIEPTPNMSEKPNQVFGLVLDSSGRAVSQALIEIVDQNQQSLRIVKSNALGEFRIATALPDGDYLIKTEAENLDFRSQALHLDGKNSPAIKIIAEAAGATLS